MSRPIYACDRCGHWFTTAKQFASYDLPFEPDAMLKADPKGRDFCAQCSHVIIEMAQYLGMDRLWDALDRWVAEGKGVAVKPRSVR